MNKETIIRKHFHGFSDEKWEEIKNIFPYSEIPYIIDHAIINCIDTYITPEVYEQMELIYCPRCEEKNPHVFKKGNRRYCEICEYIWTV